MKRLPLILSMVAVGWLTTSLGVAVLRPVHADDPPAPPDTTVSPTGEVFTDAPQRQGVTLAVDASCEYMTVYFNSTPTATLEGLTLEASVDDSGQWTTLDAGQSALRFDGWHTAIEGRILVDGKQVDSEHLFNLTACPPFDTPPPTTT